VSVDLTTATIAANGALDRNVCSTRDDYIRTILEAAASLIEAAVREQIARAVEAARSVHWQEHLREHPLADAKSCPGDYAAHDAYYHAARIARGEA
jgi:hypothetical protein